MKSVKDDIHALGRAHNYALHPAYQKFPQHCLWNNANVRLTDDGPLSPFFKEDRQAFPLSTPLAELKSEHNKVNEEQARVLQIKQLLGANSHYTARVINIE